MFVPVLSQDLKCHMSWSCFMFSGLRWEVDVHSLDIGGIVDHHCIKFFFIMIYKTLTKTKYLATRITLKTVSELMYSRKVSSACSLVNTSGDNSICCNPFFLQLHFPTNALQDNLINSIQNQKCQLDLCRCARMVFIPIGLLFFFTQ